MTTDSVESTVRHPVLLATAAALPANLVLLRPPVPQTDFVTIKQENAFAWMDFLEAIVLKRFARLDQMEKCVLEMVTV